MATANMYVSVRTAAFPGGDPIADVFVALHTAALALVSAGTTDVDGKIFLGNNELGEYELRVTALAGGYLIPQGGNRLTVSVASEEDQVFDVVMETSGSSVPADPNFCRCHGVVLSSAGLPVKGASLFFSEGSAPNLLHYAGTDTTKIVVPATISVKTDNLGRATVDLLRGAHYSVTLSGYENQDLYVEVPDLPAASLADVLFPTVDRVQVSLDGVVMPVGVGIDLAVGGECDIALAAVMRSGVKKAGLYNTTHDLGTSEVLEVTTLTDSVIHVKALATGAVIVKVTRGDTEDEEKLWKAPALRGGFTITVT